MSPWGPMRDGMEQSATTDQDRLFINNIPASNQDLLFSVSLTADLNLSFLLFFGLN